MLFNTSLWLHVIGITCMAGATVVEYVLARKFWRIYARNPQSGILGSNITANIPLLTMVGMLLILLSGVGMMIATRGVFDSMLWFRIKMALVVIVILNAILNGRKQRAKLDKLLVEAVSPDPQQLAQARKHQRNFYISQLFLFLIIFLLSTFKFK